MRLPIRLDGPVQNDAHPKDKPQNNHQAAHEVSQRDLRHIIDKRVQRDGELGKGGHESQNNPDEEYFHARKRAEPSDRVDHLIGGLAE